MQNCPLFSPEPTTYITYMRIYPFINVPINVFCTYCILFGSTPAMYAYRLRLLHVQVISALTDILIFLSIPVLFFPLPASYPLGVLALLKINIHYLNVSILIAFALNIGCVFQIFIFHLKNILPSYHFVKLSKKSFRIFICLIYALNFVPALYFSRTTKSTEESEKIKNKFKAVRRSHLSKNIFIKTSLKFL